MPSPLQNRVSPSGDIIANPARGEIFGNRGGQFHDPERQTLAPRRRWASRSWIICVLQFRGRQRNVWSNSFTELFFLDEVTALAAGHRPCFECRSAAAKMFAAAVAKGHGRSGRMMVGELDQILHAQRRSSRKIIPVEQLPDCPDGTMIARASKGPSDGPVFLAKKDGLFHPWDWGGFKDPVAVDEWATVELVTPQTTILALNNGYKPTWHSSLS